MLSFVTKRLVTDISSRFRSNALKVTNMVATARSLASHSCRKPYEMPCKMEYPKKKCEEPPCRPLEPCCPVAFTECPVHKPDPCKPRPDCCGSERIARDPCNCRGARSWKKKDVKLTKEMPKQSVWEYPADCCGNPCPEMPPRFDRMYYVPTDKAKRQYQQTWVECPQVQIRKRRVCCYDSSVLPPICRRKKADCPITACAFDSQKLGALCSFGLNKRCPAMQAACCLRGRYPPRCYRPRYPTKCKKKCCPYPSFSKCCCPCPNPERIRECKCTDIPPLCIIYRGRTRKLLYDLPPPLPNWPPKMIPAR